MMDGVGRGFPPGDMRVSDADRDRAVAELNEAFRVGRITASEFDQRAGLAVRARTGRELISLLADLPPEAFPAARAPAAAAEPARHYFGVRVVMGVSAFCALLLFAKAVTAAAAIGMWAGMAPAAIAVLLVGLVIFLHAIHAGRS